jgi:hypothetical protein
MEQREAAHHEAPVAVHGVVPPILIAMFINGGAPPTVQAI